MRVRCVNELLLNTCASNSFIFVAYLNTAFSRYLPNLKLSICGPTQASKCSFNTCKPID